MSRWVQHSIVIGVLLGALLGSAAPAGAKERRHRVRPGETAASLAKHFYGASWKGIYILTRNSVSNDALPVGKRVVIPASWTYTARRGDSYASIAKRGVGQPERYTALLRFNRLSERSELQVGQKLLMPFHLRHSVREGESLSQISRLYYRTAKLGAFLKQYNGFDSTKIEVGQRVTVPIFDRSTLEVGGKPAPPAPSNDARKPQAPPTEPAEPELPPESKASEPIAASLDTKTTEPTTTTEPMDGEASNNDTPAKTPPATLATVQEAIGAYRGGFFRQSCETFERLLEGKGLEPTQRSRVIQYLGFCSVAFDDENAARDYFRTWLLTDPEATLDRRLTSPKILLIFDEVSDEVRPSN